MSKVSRKIAFEQAHESGKEMAAYWVEHVMKHGHLYERPTSQDLSYMQCHGLDILVASAVIGSMVVVACIKLCRTVSKKIRRKRLFIFKCKSR